MERNGNPATTRWTQQEEADFLAALARCGVVKQAAAAIGRSAASAYQRRRGSPALAEGWDAALAAARAQAATARTGTPPRDGRDKALPGYRLRQDGWTDKRRRLFLRALSETGCVKDACARAGISDTSAYRLRKQIASFRRDWDRAREQALPTLQQAAFERAVEGWEEPIVQGGKVVGARRRYSDSLLRLLLQRGDMRNENGAGLSLDELEEAARKWAALAGGTFRGRAEALDEEQLRAQLDAKFSEMRERLTADVSDEPAEEDLLRCRDCQRILRHPGGALMVRTPSGIGAGGGPGDAPGDGV